MIFSILFMGVHHSICESTGKSTQDVNNYHFIREHYSRLSERLRCLQWAGYFIVSVINVPYE